MAFFHDEALKFPLILCTMDKSALYDRKSERIFLSFLDILEQLNESDIFLNNC